MDQNNPVPTPPSNDQVVGFGESIKNSIKELWAKYSIFFIVVGALLLVAKFGNILMDLLAFLSKRQVENAQKQDAQLKKEEDAANQQADKLVEEAKKLPSQEGPVSEDWYKKK